MMTDYDARSVYERTKMRAQESFHKGQHAEANKKYKDAKQYYEGALGGYKNCYNLGVLYEDSGCMEESKSMMDTVQNAIDNVLGKNKDK